MQGLLSRTNADLRTIIPATMRPYLIHLHGVCNAASDRSLDWLTESRVLEKKGFMGFWTSWAFERKNDCYTLLMIYNIMTDMCFTNTAIHVVQVTSPQQDHQFQYCIKPRVLRCCCGLMLCGLLRHHQLKIALSPPTQWRLRSVDCKGKFACTNNPS